MKLKPILDKIYVKPTKSEEKTAGGIYIPEMSQGLPMKGTVLGVGSGSIDKSGNLIPLNVAEGDVVLFARGAGQPVEIDDEEHLILTQNEIIGILSEE
jgi:chaperonin GroES